MTRYVLDSSALLAVVNQEPGAAEVIKILDYSVVSSVNFCEVIGKLVLNGIAADQAATTLNEMMITIAAFDENIAFIAASISPQTQTYGLSLGDRACLATAQHLDMDVLTADRIWAKLKMPIKIKVIR